MGKEPSFYFYDLETSGVSPREARIMQFAGQRTNMDLEPIGEPHNVLVRLSEDVLPQPDAVMITGITPQQTVAEGINEADFLRLFNGEIAQPGTIFVGYNNVRFDDEFMRYAHYRNFYDPYKWHWQDGRSRWDLLDVVRMMRALRPDGIKWAYAPDGKPTNRLELLTELNNLSHDKAHDALSDVHATIAAAKLIKDRQPKLFDYLLSMRDKNKVKQLVENQPFFTYTSGRYAGETQKTTFACRLGETQDGSVLVYDLRHDPALFIKMSDTQLRESLQRKRDEEGPHLPIKALRYNRCPAVAPASVVDKESQKRLSLDPKQSQKYAAQLRQANEFIDRCIKVFEAVKTARFEQSQLLEDTHTVDERLYNGFIPKQDEPLMSRVRAAEPAELSEIEPSEFSDKRLSQLLPLYKARNFPKR